MKNKKFLGIPAPIIIAVLAVLLIGGGVLAGVLATKTVPGTVQVVATYDLSLWTSTGCSTPLTVVDFGEVPMLGGTVTGDVFYVRNDSDKPIYVRVSSDLSSTTGVIDFGGINTGGEIAPGNTVMCTPVLTMKPNSEGTRSFTITVNGQNTAL